MLFIHLHCANFSPSSNVVVLSISSENNSCCSVVVPVFNSQPTLQVLIESIENTFQNLDLAFEIILVNDGSQDKTTDEIEKLSAAASSKIQAYHLQKNRGQHVATFWGIQHANCSCVITIDDDLQFDPKDIAKLWNAYLATGADIVYGVPQKKKNGWLRNIGSKISLWLFNHLIGTPKQGSSFRLISKKILTQLKQTKTEVIFLDGLISTFQPQVAIVEVSHHKRMYGKSGYKWYKLVFWAAKTIWSHRKGKRPDLHQRKSLS